MAAAPLERPRSNELLDVVEHFGERIALLVRPEAGEVLVSPRPSSSAPVWAIPSPIRLLMTESL